MMKNCGDAVHAYVAERDVLKEMVKIVKKKASFCIGYELYYYIPYFRNKVIYIYFFFLQKLDGLVKQKILSLIDIWQEALGGPLGKFPQYYATYQQLLVIF
jgi:hypothetical protein